MDSVEKLAHGYAVDYKPWDTDLPPSDYMAYGFTRGFKHVIHNITFLDVPDEEYSEIELCDTVFHNGIKYIVIAKDYGKVIAVRV